ncbi:MAG: MgtC/SapB family protein [Chloroflexi bacterium]|nr:MgtC/SapB family protein [Chloroflexota bacterium]
MNPDVVAQLDLGFRILVAAALGAAVGAEREIHGHPAGIRTHMLVALGSALFTVLSIHGFTADGKATGSIDPTRIAAQIVSGIGFLGAGAILKDGVVIRGLTTAASLWATSAVGMAAGAGEYVVGTFGAVIILTSLWPINAIAERFHGTATPEVQVRLELKRVEAIGDISSTMAEHKIDIASIQTQRLGKDSYRADLSIRGRSNAAIGVALESIARIPGVDIITTSRAD